MCALFGLGHPAPWSWPKLAFLAQEAVVFGFAVFIRSAPAGITALIMFGAVLSM